MTMFNRTFSRLKINLGFVFFILLFVSFSAESSCQVFNPLVDETEAIQMLETALPDLQTNLDRLDPSTSAHANALRLFNFHQHIYETLMSGESLHNSLVAAFGEFAIDEYDRPASMDVFSTMTPNDPSYGDREFDKVVKFLEK